MFYLLIRPTSINPILSMYMLSLDLIPVEIIHARVLQSTVNPLTPKIGVVILLTVCRMIFILLVGKFGTGSISNLIVGIFLYSHHLSA